MSRTRRDFLKVGAAVAAGTMAASSPHLAHSSSGLLVPITDLPPVDDPAIKALMEVALNTARSGGASYADVRVAARRQQNVSTRDRIVQGVSDTDTYGIGVRTLVDGAWGFAATTCQSHPLTPRVIVDYDQH